MRWPLVAAVAAVLAGGAAAFPLLLGLSPWVFAGLAAVAAVAAVAVQRRLRRPVVSTVLGVLVVAVAIQAVPYGWARSNPPVTAEPVWDSLRTRELTARACFDCHSNEVRYPWYAYVAPMSWAVQRHVAAGRGKVNYSEWDRPQEEAGESAETVEERSMPPRYYTLVAHGGARLTAGERQALIDGLNATIGERDSDRDDD